MKLYDIDEGKWNLMRKRVMKRKQIIRELNAKAIKVLSTGIWGQMYDFARDHGIDRKAKDYVAWCIASGMSLTEVREHLNILANSTSEQVVGFMKTLETEE